ncbi:MAG TPA: hypothetical protein VFS67_09280 [Polyangiaceae bacterium]|nr:hypothetical protein [Polyangiaceae bacterium]
MESRREWVRLGAAAALGAAAVLAFDAIRAHPAARGGVAQPGTVGAPPAVEAQVALESAGLPLTGAGGAALANPPGRTPAKAQLAAQLESVNGKLARVQSQKDALQQQQRELEGQLRSLEDQVAERDRYKYDLTADDWRQLASEARVRYRVPCLMPLEAHWKMASSELDRLGLSPDDGELVAEAQRRSNRRIWDTLRPLCLQIVSDAEVVDLLGAASCLQLIEKVASRRDLSASVAARRQVAEVNAGLRVPPPAGQPQHPVFEALLAMSQEARRFEADLAESFGPEEAQRVWRSMSCAMTRD